MTLIIWVSLATKLQKFTMLCTTFVMKRWHMRLFSRWRGTGKTVTCSTGTTDHAVTVFLPCVCTALEYKADSRLAPSQIDTSLQRNAVFHWLDVNLENGHQCSCYRYCCTQWWWAISKHNTGYKIRYDILNSSPPRQHSRHFVDDIFRCIFLNENVWISIQVSLLGS